MIVLIQVVAQGLFSGEAFAGNAFYVGGDIYYSNNGVESAGYPIIPEVTGDPVGTVNAYATTWAWRSNVQNQTSQTDVPFDQTYPPDPRCACPGPAAAYSGWDVGSSAWPTTPAIGDQTMTLAIAENGLNGWTGSTWVGAAEYTLVANDIHEGDFYHRDIVMEPVPTPVLTASTTSSITVGWQGLWDNSTGAAGGSGPASVVGYSLYRSVNGGALTLLAGVAQDAGGAISYVDSAVAQGSTYTYALGVRFLWAAQTPAYYEATKPAGLGPISAVLAPGPTQPVQLNFLSGAPSMTAGTTSPVLTLESEDGEGNTTAVTANTTVNLTDTSTGLNAKFYAVSGNACTTTQITSITMLSGTSTAQLCYYDEKAGSWSLTAAATGLTSASLGVTVTANPTLSILVLKLASAPLDRTALTGTNSLTAEDTYGNTIPGFSAATTPVTFTTAPSGVALSGLDGTGNAQLVAPSDFANGVANLSGKLILSGTAGTYTVTAATAGGVSTSALVTLSPGALNHFSFALASPQAVATAFTGTDTLTALDADNNVITGFNAATNNVTVTESAASGTVSGLGSGNVLNGAGTFVNGVANVSSMVYTGAAVAHTFTATSGSSTGISNSVSFTRGPFAKFAVTLNTPQVNGVAFANAAITAQDVAGNTVTNFDASANNVTVTGSGGGVVVGGSLVTAGSFVNGVATLSGALTYTGVVGSHLFTVTSADGKTGTATAVITAGAVTSVQIVNGTTSAAAPVGASALTADQNLPLWAAGYDASGNWAGLVTGTWSSSGTLAPTVSASAVNTFVFNPTTAPASGTITVTSGALTNSTGTVTVSNGAFNGFIVTAPTPAVATAGTAIELPQIEAVDSHGNQVLSYSGAKTLVFSGPSNAPNAAPPTYPSSVTFTNGVATNVPVTLVKAQTVDLTATQGGHNGQSIPIVVTAAPATAFTVGAPATATAGTAFDVPLAADDSFGNLDLTYTGSHAIVFSGAASSPGPAVTTPSYPSSVTFTDGAGTASIALYDRQTATLTATEGALVGASGPIVIGAGPAVSIAPLSALTQSGAVSQEVPTQPEVLVKDAYGNSKNGFSVSFGVTAGGGTAGAPTVSTASNGTATVTWVLGPTSGTDNNTLASTGVGLAGSPVTFTASAQANHFEITVPGGIVAGVAFQPTISMLDVNDQVIPAYAGSKPVSFSGPGVAADGTRPTFPSNVTFVGGVANPLPTMILTLAETTTLTMTDGTVTGTSGTFDVAPGPAFQVAFASQPQTITVNDVSAPIDLCVEDQYGDAFVGAADRQLLISTTSRGGQFSAASDPSGTWGISAVTLTAGLSCVNVYYRDADSYPGTSTLQAGSSLLTASTQPIVMSGTGTSTTTTTSVPSSTTSTTTPSSTTTTTSPGGPPPLTAAMLVYLSGAPTLVAGTTSAVLTVQSADISGDTAAVSVDTTVTLTTNSSGSNAEFFAVASGACTSTVITTLTMAAGSDIAQFCYSDQVAGTWTLTAQASGLAAASQDATVTSSTLLGSMVLTLAHAQSDRDPFVGTNTLTAKDLYGNTITGFSAVDDPLTFSVSPAGATVGGLGGTANAQLVAAGDFVNGVADLSGQLELSGTAGSYSVAVADGGGIVATAPVTLGDGALDHFALALSSPQAVGTPFSGMDTLTAQDADGNVVTGFNAATNNVTVTESAADGTVSGLGSGNVISGAGAFVNGIADVSSMVYSGTAAAHTFTATSGSSMGTSNSVTFVGGPAAGFTVSLNTPQPNATPFASAVITAVDASGNTATGFDASSDNVTISVTGRGVITPATLTAGNSFANGVATLNNLTYTGPAGSQVFTVSSANGSTGTATAVITAGAVTSVMIVNAGTSNATHVTASALTADQDLTLWSAGYDTSGNWAGLIAGTWSSGGTLAPAVNASAVNTFVFSPTTAPASGSITFTSGGLTDSTGSITVTPGVENGFVVTAPTAAMAGVQATLPQIEAVDGHGNLVPTYTGAQTLVFSGPTDSPIGTPPSYPVSVTFATGVATNIPVTLYKAEMTTITVSQASHTGSSGDFTVLGGSASTFSLDVPATAIAGTAFTVSVVADDPWGNASSGYVGDHALLFSGPGSSPNSNAPSYQSSVTFSGGVGSAAVTLYKRETTTLRATEGPVTGTSGLIGVGAGAAESMAIGPSASATQNGAVSQVVPTEPVVDVADGFGNAKDGFTVDFAVATGGGTVDAATAVTASDGSATVNWTLGSTPATSPGDQNNELDVTAPDVAGSPVVFTASAGGDHFVITVPSGVTPTAGVPFHLEVSALDFTGAAIVSYDGTKTPIFTGPISATDGSLPQYPGSIDFSSGVTTSPLPEITLVSPSLTTLTLTDGYVVGTVVFTVATGAAAKLAIVSAPQSIAPDVASSAVVVCIQDQYGNSVIPDGNYSLQASSTSSGGQFSIQPSGPWSTGAINLRSPPSCMNIYYEDLDTYPGVRVITLGSPGLQSISQDISISGTVPPPTTTTTTETTTAPTTSTTRPTSTTGPPTTSKPSASTTVPTSPVVPSRGPTGGSSPSSVSVPVYPAVPTQPTDEPVPSPTIDIPIPVTSFPVITSPEQGALITPIGGGVIVTGTGPASSALTIVTDSGSILAGTTSSSQGVWQIVVASGRFDGATPTIHATLLDGSQSASVSFSFKQESLLDKILGFLSVTDATHLPNAALIPERNAS